MSLEYFFRNQAEQYAFIRIPRAMMTEEIFSPLSVEAKLLYGLLLDMMSYSTKNRWVDEKNRVYVIYPVSRIQDDMCVSKGKALDCLQELEDFGLIDRKRHGQGKPDYIYLKNFVVDNAADGI